MCSSTCWVSTTAAYETLSANMKRYLDGAVALHDLSRTSERAKRQKAARDPDTVAELTTHEQLAVLRRELNGLVAAWHHRTGKPHGAIHAELRATCGGPPTAVATAQQVQDRIETMRRWARARR